MATLTRTGPNGVETLSILRGSVTLWVGLTLIPRVVVSLKIVATGRGYDTIA